MLVHPEPVQSCTLTDLLNKYTGVQTTEGKDYNCDQCQKKVRIRVQYKLEQVHGSSVIVYIERRLASGVGKNTAPVHYDVHQDFETSQGIYNGFLVAVEVYYGDTWDTGHFVVYKRQVRDNFMTTLWIKQDDHKGTPVSEYQVGESKSVSALFFDVTLATEESPPPQQRGVSEQPTMGYINKVTRAVWVDGRI